MKPWAWLLSFARRRKETENDGQRERRAKERMHFNTAGRGAGRDDLAPVTSLSS